MSETADTAPQNENPITLKKVAIDSLTLTATHPITYVKTLIQLGHEPMDPYKARNWAFWSEGFYRPGFLRYSLHIKSMDGFFGLFRGLTPRLGSCLTYNLSSRILEEQLVKHVNLCPSEVDVNESWEAGFQKTGRKIVQKSLAETGAIIISHPLHVLAIRSMAQFISREEAYDSLIGGILEIKDEEGVKGFFAGLVPKVVGAILGIAFIETLSFALKKQLNSCDEEVKTENKDLFQLINQHIAMFASVVAGSFTYPFVLTSTIMAVNGSRLKCASGHTDWTACLSELRALKAAQRGSSIFFGRKAAYKEAALKMAAFALGIMDGVKGLSDKCVITPTL